MIIKPVNTNRINKEIKRKSKNESLLRVNLADSLDRSKEKYLDRYEGIKSEILNTTRFDDNLDLSTTYLGKINSTWDIDLTIEREISNNGAWAYSRQTIRWYRISDIIRHRRK